MMTSPQNSRGLLLEKLDTNLRKMIYDYVIFPDKTFADRSWTLGKYDWPKYRGQPIPALMKTSKAMYRDVVALGYLSSLVMTVQYYQVTELYDYGHTEDRCDESLSLAQFGRLKSEEMTEFVLVVSSRNYVDGKPCSWVSSLIDILKGYPNIRSLIIDWQTQWPLEDDRRLTVYDRLPLSFNGEQPIYDVITKYGKNLETIQLYGDHRKDWVDHLKAHLTAHPNARGTEIGMKVFKDQKYWPYPFYDPVPIDMRPQMNSLDWQSDWEIDPNWENDPFNLWHTAEVVEDWFWDNRRKRRRQERDEFLEKRRIIAEREEKEEQQRKAKLRTERKAKIKDKEERWMNGDSLPTLPPAPPSPPSPST
ncbi:hypothetical protein F5Y16DRAFT_358730 [Xylariaceae sp. FL0255]|nr:hypothetical protein F5Y16DRAFT_358730 [Xylariaceae sp. FL0255]